MTATATVRSVISHRGMSCLELHQLLGRLERENRTLKEQAGRVTAVEGLLDEQAKTITDLQTRLDEATRQRDDTNAKASQCRDAEDRAAAAEQQLAARETELRELRAFKDNATAVTVDAVGERDTSAPEDQATTPIQVLTLPQAFGSADPAYIPAWART